LNRALHEELNSQPANEKFFAFHGTHCFMSEFTRAGH
jgi:hypothetical protein